MFFLKPEQKFDIKLQSPSKSFWSTFKKAFLVKKDFKNFWKNLEKSNLPDELRELTSKFVNSESYNTVSKFWRHLVINHFKALAKATSKEMQNSIIHSDYVARTYFNKENFASLENIDFTKEEINFDPFTKHKNINHYDSLSYNMTTAIYFSKKKDILKKYYHDINKKFYEEFSSSLKINNYDINQHLMYSINELQKIDLILSEKKENIKIIEFGAGYGRTANVILSTKKKVKYIIVDIPPSLYVSTLHFRKHHPNLKISHAFDINNKEYLEEEIDKNDIIYIFPHQLKFLRENYFDLSIMIGIINETEPKTLMNYMHYVNKISRNLYMKVFKYSGLPFSFYNFYRYNNKNDYFIPNEWFEQFSEKGMESDLVYHLGYKIK